MNETKMQGKAKKGVHAWLHATLCFSCTLSLPLPFSRTSGSRRRRFVAHRTAVDGGEKTDVAVRAVRAGDVNKLLEWKIRREEQDPHEKRVCAVQVRAPARRAKHSRTSGVGGWAKTLVVATVGKGGAKKKKEKTGSQYTGSQRPGHKT
ncbi:hypothetical protein B0H16DRAFT_1482479 [Mycena metata]|uniref:Uncharacterized protein n=1 Tax=Mycena metata TaxID=1033252 RepID=A0AAD7GT40_9AGAR|nr:hypothetical protein B0H16DRAFT_1482479 [Mycena metata]